MDASEQQTEILSNTGETTMNTQDSNSSVSQQPADEEIKHETIKEQPSIPKVVFKEEDKSLLNVEEIQGYANQIFNKYYEQLQTINLSFQMTMMNTFQNLQFIQKEFTDSMATLQMKIKDNSVELNLNSLNNPIMSNVTPQVCSTIPSMQYNSPLNISQVNTTYGMPQLSSGLSYNSLLTPSINQNARYSRPGSRLSGIPVLSTPFGVCPEFLFIFEDNIQKSISINLLSKYPNCLLTKKASEESNSTSNSNSILISHPATYFDIIYTYLESDNINIDDLDEDVIYNIYYEFIYYNLPLPVSMSQFIRERPKLGKWTEPIMHIYIDNKQYDINRDTFEIHHINNSIFQEKKKEEEITVDENNLILFNIDFHYFNYIYEYITEGTFSLSESDSIYYYSILKEFEMAKIILPSSITDPYVQLTTNHFKDSKILIDIYSRPLLQWLGNTSYWTLIYQGSRDGYSAESFHNHCDKKGPTVTIIRNKDNNDENIFGGYTSANWVSEDTLVTDSHAFLYTIKNPFNIPPTSFPVKNPNYAIWCNKNFGPHFGDFAHLGIDTNDNNEEKPNGYVNFGCTQYNAYEDTTGKYKSLFTNTNKANLCNLFHIDEIEVFALNTTA
ncbi:hypothetical protein WA158_005642 [Blastocystis sp. Blastoise]